MKFTDGSSSIFVETKNYLKSSISSIVAKPDFLNQFKAYIAEINSIDDMKYFFRSNEGVTKIFLKGKFKTMISNNSDLIFNQMNSSFKQSLGLTGLTAKSKFELLISNTNSDLYKFIEIN